MNEAFINNHNSLVGKNDIAYFLGDVFFGSKDGMREIMAKLNGVIYLVKGNHEKYGASFYRSIGFKEVYNQLTINIKETPFLLTHRPNFESGMNTLCGHVHESWRFQKNCLNVGVDQHNFFPINQDQVLKYFGH